MGAGISGVSLYFASPTSTEGYRIRRTLQRTGAVTRQSVVQHYTVRGQDK